MDAESLFLSVSKFLPLLVFPLSVVCLALAVATLAPLRASWRRSLAAGALALLLAASCSPLSKGLGRSLEWQNLPRAEYPVADAIVLLGGATRPASFPRGRAELDESSDRIFEAARLYHAGKAPRLHIAGGRLDWGANLGPETPDIEGILHDLSVPSEVLVRDNVSRNTYENATVAKRMLEPLGVKRILLVTSALHMPRAAGLFRRQGFEVIPAPADFRMTAGGPEAPLFEEDLRSLLLQGIPQAETLAYTTNVLREWLGILVYRMRGLMD